MVCVGDYGVVILSFDVKAAHGLLGRYKEYQFNAKTGVAIVWTSECEYENVIGRFRARVRAAMDVRAAVNVPARTRCHTAHRADTEGGYRRPDRDRGAIIAKAT